MADTNHIRLLLLEDNSDDAEIVLRELKKAGFLVEATVVQREEEFRHALRDDPDLIVSDHGLPGFSSIKALEYAHEYNEEIPFVIVSGAISEETAVEAMRRGAADYLLKDRLTRLGEAVRLALHQRQIAREKREAIENIRRSEERYRLLAEHATDLISKHSPDGKVLYASPACLPLLSYNPDELLGHAWYELIHPDDIEAIRESFNPAVEPPPITVFTYRIRRKDGTHIWFETTSKVIKNEDDEVVEIISVSRDVTARQESELALQRSEERWRRLLEVDPSGLMVTRKGRIEFVNRAAASLLGAEDKKLLLGRPVANFFHREDDLGEIDSWLEQVHEKGSLPSRQFRLARVSGESTWVEVVSIGTVYHGRAAVLSVFQDISERRRYELALVEAKEHAEQMSELKSVFLMNMSHEIRTPLTGIIGLSEILAEATPEESREFAGLIWSSGQRLLDTLNSVLDLAALEGGGVEIKPKPVHINDVVHSSVALFRQAAEKRGLGLRVENRSTEAIVTQTDEGSLARVLNNLLSNAIKFTEKGEVVVRLGVDESEVYIDIEDTGIGISPRFLSHLFDDFKQESSGVSRSHEGNGLGLSISKRLVDLLGGRISVESRKGEGSRFTVYLPLQIEAAERSKQAGNEEPALSPTLRVLAVEDKNDTLLVLEKMLASQCELQFAVAAHDAREALRNGRFDVALIDLGLGGGNHGIDLAEWCRAELAMPPRLIAFTTVALPGNRSGLLKRGFDDYLAKPFTRRELLEVLSAASTHVSR